MRGAVDPQLAMLTTLCPDSLIRVDHPIRRIRVVDDAVLGDLDEVFDEMYVSSGRSSVPPTDRDSDNGPSGPPAGRNVEVGWHGQQRSNDPHESTTDAEARLYRKSNNTAATLCYLGHVLMENRNALLVDAEFTAVTGFAARDTAAEMLGRLSRTSRRLDDFAMT